VRLADAPDPARLRAALAGAPDVELRAAEGLRSAAAEKPIVRLGPIDAAQSERLLVGELRPDPRHAGGYWLWATLDNLTAGGALNALAIAGAVA